MLLILCYLCFQMSKSRGNVVDPMLIFFFQMSKSRGNVVDPMLLKEKYSAEVFRYLLLREGVPHNDGSK